MLRLPKLVEEIETLLVKIAGGIEKTIEYQITKLRTKIIRFLLQMVITATSLVLIIIGTVIFFSRFFPLDLVLLISGAILLYTALISKALHK